MSDWKEKSIERRDARHGGDVPISKTIKRTSKKHWCVVAYPKPEFIKKYNQGDFMALVLGVEARVVSRHETEKQAIQAKESRLRKETFYNKDRFDIKIERK